MRDAIDGLAAEDTWSYGNGSTEDWDAGGGDDGPYDISDRLACEVERCDAPLVAPDNVCPSGSDAEGCEDKLPVSGDLHGGIPAFTVDYCIRSSCADTGYAAARAHGLVPLVTRVQLSQLTNTPPWD